MEMESNVHNAYQTAYNMACEKLSKRNPEEISSNTDCVYNKNDNSLNVQYLGHEYTADCETGEVVCGDDDTAVTTTVKVLILHYLLHAVKRPPLGKLISFREVRGGGANYYPTFAKRAILPLQKTFENNLDKLVGAGKQLKGKSESYGDASISIPVFPLVSVTYVVWQGDEEIDSSAAILFDANVNSFLPCEDIVLAASFGTYELMRIAKSLS